jgi:hypothetical protein
VPINQACPICVRCFNAERSLAEHVWAEHLERWGVLCLYRICWCGHLVNKDDFLAHVRFFNGCFSHHLAWHLGVVDG